MWTKLDTNIKPIYAHSIEEFNSYVNKYKTKNQIILTKSGNISQENLRHLPCSLTWKRGNRMEFQYIDGNTQIRVLYALHYDDSAKDKDEWLSYDALNYFDGLMDKIPTDDVEPDTGLFTCEENPESAYYNYVDERYIGVTLEHCYSLDRNNSFMASMKEVYPETAPFVDNYYKNRLIMKEMVAKGKADKTTYERFKLYGSIFVGWLNNTRYHRKNAWKKIVSNSNMKVHQLREYIESKGNEVVLVNTDAVKFIGYVPFEDNYDLGGFKYEWKDTDMYIKGVKSYAYLDNGNWKFKQAGKCKLDLLKPDRDTWTMEEFKHIDTITVTKIIIQEDGTLKEVLR